MDVIAVQDEGTVGEALLGSGAGEASLYERRAGTKRSRESILDSKTCWA